MKWAWVVGVVMVVLFMTFQVISARNRLIELDENINSQWSEITNQLKRRADLIPQLLGTAKKYAEHEKTVFAAVADARSQLLNAKSPADAATADYRLVGALGRLLAIAERYPQLKADRLFIRLQDEIAGTENRVSVARKRYNDAVKDYNAAIRKFPGSIFAKSLDFSKREYYEPQEKFIDLDKAAEIK